VSERNNDIRVIKTLKTGHRQFPIAHDALALRYNHALTADSAKSLASKATHR